MTNFATNRKAFHSYTILETFEAGLVLAGHEVKSVRTGNASLAGAFVVIRNGEAFLKNTYIGKYKHSGNLSDHDESRDRKLLMHKKELVKLGVKTKEQGLALVPLEIYARARRLKLKLGLCQGKKKYDKRESIRAKETKRRLDRVVKNRP